MKINNEIIDFIVCGKDLCKNTYNDIVYMKVMGVEDIYYWQPIVKFIKDNKSDFNRVFYLFDNKWCSEGMMLKIMKFKGFI